MKKPIGVIDSGVGGLTVVQELFRQLPNEELIYIGDSARCPYGSRAEEEVRMFTWEMVRYLLKKDIKMLVIACNTATAFTLEELQENLEIPVIGVINSGARAAISNTVTKHVGVIGTEGTIRSNAYTNVLKEINADIQVEALACPLLAPMVEKGIVSGPHAVKVVSECLEPFKKNKKMDSLILGCTHYPLLKNTIQQVLGDKVKIISSSEETARETGVILDIHGLLNVSNEKPIHQILTTGDLDLFSDLTKKIFINSPFTKLEINKAILNMDQEIVHPPN